MSVLTPIHLPDVGIPPVPVRRFSVDEYLGLVKTGFFAADDRNELLEGWIVPKMTMNPPHAVAVALADAAFGILLPINWHLRGQSTVTTTDSAPEPDLAVIRGAIRHYLGRHPGPRDTALALEVADSSLADDRKLKGRIYARAGIPFFWIVNLVDRQVEVYSDSSGPSAEPTYRKRRDYRSGEMIPLILDGAEVGQVAVDDLLP